MFRAMFFTLLLFTCLTGCGIEWFPPPPANVKILTTSLPNATLTAAYSQTLVAFGGVGPYTWATTTGTLPAGLTLSSAGAISGTATAAGTSTFTVQVTDSTTPVATTDSVSLTILVSASTTTPTVLIAGQQQTLISGQSVLVPAGTTVTLNGVVTTVGSTPVTTSALAFVAVPVTATGPSNILVTAQ